VGLPVRNLFSSLCKFSFELVPSPGLIKLKEKHNIVETQLDGTLAYCVILDTYHESWVTLYVSLSV
jgi:hypothetical protein